MKKQIYYGKAWEDSDLFNPHYQPRKVGLIIIT